MMLMATSPDTSWTVTWIGVLDLVSAFALLCGLFFMLVGAVGVFRMPDSYQRMHAASKCTTLGLTGMLIAACVHIGTVDVYSKAILTIVFTFVATPIGTHLLAKAAHRGRVGQWGASLEDEYAADLGREPAPAVGERAVLDQAD